MKRNIIKICKIKLSHSNFKDKTLIKSKCDDVIRPNPKPFFYIIKSPIDDIQSNKNKDINQYIDGWSGLVDPTKVNVFLLLRERERERAQLFSYQHALYPFFATLAVICVDTSYRLMVNFSYGMCIPQVDSGN